ncbi:MAG: signal recognition particle receptor subunit alpha [Butyricicoccus pullicaecorum]
MAFEGLTEKISSAFKKLRGQTRLTEADVKDAMREIRLALLEADVNFKVTKDFIKAVTEQATDAEILESLSPAQQVIKIVNDELIKLLGGKGARITIAPNPPTIVMMAGLQGSGKTTNAAKLAGLFKTAAAPPCSSPRRLPSGSNRSAQGRRPSARHPGL